MRGAGAAVGDCRPLAVSGTGTPVAVRDRGRVLSLCPGRAPFALPNPIPMRDK
ncbi:hypothetical protein EES40_07340 [Streptomyces sp. ADI93-02]|nr:hypothetical protein EES40_07340 [Streptomyces sp. ADI93-02]